MPSSSSSHSPPPSSSLPFLLARQIRSRRTNDESPSCQKLYGPPTKATRHPAAVVTQWLSFLFCFFIFFSHLFAPREKAVLRAYHAPVPHHRGATASPHVASRHPSPAASPRRGSTSLPRPWNASPRHVTPHPHPIFLPRNDAPWGPPYAFPSPLLTPPRRFGTPHHHGVQDPSPRHTTPPRRHIAPPHAAPPRCTSPPCRHAHATSPDTPAKPCLLPPPAALGHHPTLCISSCM